MKSRSKPVIDQATMIRDFAAHVIQLCDYVLDASRLTHLRTLQSKAQALKGEAYGISKTFYP